eukprot:scaffold804_cov165-Amphora_coffeaeformis.AAC.31
MPIDKSLAKKAFAEFLGMTMFVYIGTGAVVSTGEQLASSAAPTAASVARVLPISFAFGMSIMVQAFSFGHISGGHFNPAVSFFMYLIDKIKLDQFLCFVAAQIAGAFMGSLLLWGSVSGMSEDRSSVQEQVIGSPPFNLGANGLNAALSPGNGFLLELMGTFLLCMAVMMTTQHSNSLSQGAPHMAPLAIGFAVFLAHVVLVPLTGCGINPARSLVLNCVTNSVELLVDTYAHTGPVLVNAMASNNVLDDASYIYYVAPFTASLAASVVYKYVFPPEETPALVRKETAEAKTGEPDF